MLYIFLITIAMLISIGISVTVSLTTGLFSVSYAILSSLCALLYELLLMGIIDLIIRFLLPKKLWNYENKIYKVSKKEIKFYEKLKIRKWKDLIPELGNTAGFSKKNFKTTEIKYIERFIYETCIGEIFHYSCAILGITCIFIFPISQFYLFLPIAIASFILNYLPAIVQRYNRYKWRIIRKE